MAELEQVLVHQWDAVDVVDARLAVLEDALAVGSPDEVAVAVGSVRRAAARVSALRLTRSLALATLGISPDLDAHQIAEVLDRRGGPDCRMVAEALTAAVDRANARRDRAAEALAGPDGRCPGGLGPELRA